MDTRFTLTALAASLLSGLAVGQTCTAVQDLNLTGSGFSSNPDGATFGYNAYVKDSFVQLGSSWYFRADSSTTGQELFSTDGTSATPTLVKDINPGAGDSSIGQMIAYNGKLWFTASDGVSGAELWMSDGTTAGTVMVKDIFPGSTGSSVSSITGMGGKVYFSASDGSIGGELWVSDGTAAGTMLVKDIRPGTSSSGLTRFVLHTPSNSILFRATDGSNGFEVWSTDGTAAGTQMVADVNPGTGSSFPDYFIPFNGDIYFSANDGSTGTELWKTNGTAAGTMQVADIRPGTSSSSVNLNYFADFNGELYFRARNTNGNELYKTDGTPAGTVEVADIRVGSGSSSPADMIVYNGFVYFTADDAATFGRELWRTDGTTLGTTVVTDIQVGGGDGFSTQNNNLMVSNGKLFMAARSAGSDTELWMTTGGPATLVKDIEVGTTGSFPDWLTPTSATEMIFSANTAATGKELWVTDGTTAGTKLLAEVDSNFLSNDANPEQMHSVDGQYLVMNAEDGILGEELYRWDAATGLTLIKDIRPGSSDSLISGFTTAYLGGKLQTFFAANDGVNGTELWVTDGTTAGTQMLKDIFVGSSSSNPSNFFFHEGHGLIYFKADDALTGVELWRTDGTAAGTVMVADIAQGTTFGGSPKDSSPANMAAFGPLLVFAANDGVNGLETWVSDGSTFGTSMLADLATGSSGSFPHDFTEFGGKLLFAASGSGTGAELYESDGTTLGTQLVKDIRPGSSGSNLAFFTPFNGEVFFAANDANFGTELWKTDGTLAGTMLVSDINPGFSSSSPDRLTVAAGKLFFTASTFSLTGRELYTSDGTTAGTTIVTDLNPGNLNGDPDELTPVGNGVYFEGRSAVGKELYFSDGTAAGTTLICDLNPGSAWGQPTSLELCAGGLFFNGDDPLIGKELFMVPLAGAYVQDLGVSGDGSKLSSTFPVLGSSATVSVENAPAGSIGVLLMSAPSSPTHILTVPTSVSWIDAATFSILGVYTTPSFSLTQPVPTTPSLVGGQVHLQAWALPAGAVPASTSNGLQLVLGN